VTLIGQPLAEVEGMQEFAAAIINAFSAQSAQSAAGRNVARLHWQRQIAARACRWRPVPATSSCSTTSPT
jgi:hypothetical protein